MRGQNGKKSERGEMRCPHCGKKSLEKDPLADEQSSKKTKIIYGSQCGNPKCSRYNQRVDSERLKEQYKGGGLTSYFPNGKYAIILATILVVGLVITGFALGLIQIGPDTYTVSGQVVSPAGEPIEKATIVASSGSKVHTSSSGDYSIQLTEGEHKIHAKPPEKSELGASIEKTVIVEGEDKIEFKNGDGVMQLSNVTTYSPTGTFSKKRIFPSFENRTNGGLTKIHINTNTGKTVENKKTVNSGESNVQIEDNVTNAQIRLISEIQEKTITDEKTYTGPIEFETIGNILPDSIRVGLQKMDTPYNTRSDRVTDKKTFNINLSSESNIVATFSDGTSEKTQTKDGTWNGTSPDITITESSAPARVTAELIGTLNKEDITKTGTIENGEVSFYVEGNQNANDAIIEFTGGEATKTKISEDNFSVTGEDGTQYKEKTIKESADTGTYTLDSVFNVTKNEEYTNAGYIVGGEKYTFSQTGEQTNTFEAQEGEEIKLWAEGESEIDFNKDFPGSGSDAIKIKDYTVSNNTPDVGDSIRVYVTVENTTNAGDSIDIYLYKNGESVLKDGLSVGAGETREQVQIATLPFNSKGVYTVSVNDEDEKTIRVGGATSEYGAGSISGTLYRQAGNGSVSVDTTGDGNTDCTASSTGGTCEIGNIETGEHNFNATEMGVSNTEYRVTYTSNTSPKDVSIDLEGDGNPEKMHDGVLGENQTITAEKTLDAGTYDIEISSSNNQPVKYELTWSQKGIIQSANVTVDGNTVLDKTNIENGEEFDLGSFPEGEHVVIFNSKGGAYSTEIQWRDSNGVVYPGVSMNGRQACAQEEVANNNGYCTISAALIEEENTLQLSERYKGKNITLEYSGKSKPKSASVTINDTNINVNGEDGKIESGSWIYNKPIESLTQGENKINLSINTIDEFDNSIEMVLIYTSSNNSVKNPTVTITNDKGETNKISIPEKELTEEKFFQDKYTFEIPYKYFSAGENEIVVQTEDGSQIEVNAKIKSKIEQNVEFKDD